MATALTQTGADELDISDVPLEVRRTVLQERLTKYQATLVNLYAEIKAQEAQLLAEADERNRAELLVGLRAQFANTRTCIAETKRLLAEE